MSYWPDWVMDRCLRIVELQKQGHSLESAFRTMELERIERLVEEAASDPTDALDEVTVQFGDRKITLLEAFTLEVMGTARDLLPGVLADKGLYERLKAERVVAMALQLLAAGYNPIALDDGEVARTVPDFLVSHLLAGDSSARPLIVLPLLPALRKAFARLGQELPMEPKAMPAPQIWIQRDNETVECPIYVGGPLGFERIKDMERIVGVR